MSLRVYRRMCKQEYDSVCEKFPFSWNKGCKWFTDDINFLQRVNDKKFNNSTFIKGRYDYLIEYEVESIDKFERVSNFELMLRRKFAHMIKVISVIKY